MNQRGFATLEVILMVVVIGILASVAVPRFTDVTTKANTAKIQADLSTIDTAIQMYNLDTGQWPTTNFKTELKPYLNDFPEPPTGSAYVKGTATSKPISEINTTNGYTVADYEISSASGNISAKTVKRAMLGTNVAGDFGVK